jgi:hypothetical protein
VDYQAQGAVDAELNTSPLKPRNDGSDTDFQANGAESDAADDSTQAEETDFPPKEDIGPKIAAPKQPKPPKQPKQSKIKGEKLPTRPLPKSV